jgi:sirohydrochlorin ferrochelatase
VTTLIAVAHGTRSPTGQQQIRDLVRAVGKRQPARLAYVDVQHPRIGRPTEGIIVPLFLSTGYHVRVDIRKAAENVPITPPLGPDDVLLESMTRRLPPADAIVLAAAGSSDPGWRTGVASMAEQIGATVGYASGSGPKVDKVVHDLRRQGARRIAIAAYLLADGLFYQTLRRAGADSVTPPLCLDSAVVDLVLRRYHDALLTTASTAM